MTRDKRSFLWLALIVLGCALALTFASPDVAHADDCTRDPLNAADCMRTEGFRETIAIIVSLGGAIATVLVNILSGISVAAPPAAPPATPVTPPATPPGAPSPPPGAPPTVPAAPATPPVAPSPPREMTLTDAAGREHRYEWSEEHQGYVNIQTGGVLDPTLWSEYNRNLLENLRFIEEQRRKLESRQTDFDRQMDRMVENQRQEMERPRQEQYRRQLERKREEIKASIEDALGDAKKYASFAEGYDLFLKGLEWIKWGADRAIDVGAQLSPGTGKLVRTAYKFASGVGEGIGEGMADPSQFVSHVIKGAMRGGIDVGKDAVKDYLRPGVLKRLPKPLADNPVISKFPIPRDYGDDPMSAIPLIDKLRAGGNVVFKRIRNTANPVVLLGDKLKDLIGS